MQPKSNGSVGVILSGAFINEEMVAEYGLLPPAFLPFSQRRLFEHQVKALGPWVDSILLTVPESYTVNSADESWLSAHLVRVISVPDGLTLGESVSHTIIVAGLQGCVYILHGDTLLPDLHDFKPDSVAVAPAQGAYRWGRADQNNNDEDVLVGLFSFSSAHEFLLALELTRRNFEDALVRYSAEFPLKRVKILSWLDFGHLQNLYLSRKHARTERYFNNLNFGERSVFKTGKSFAKIKAESDWYESLPPRLRLYTPPFSDGTASATTSATNTAPTYTTCSSSGNTRKNLGSQSQPLASSSSESVGLTQLQASKIWM